MGNKLNIICFTGNSGLTDYSVSLSRALLPHADIELVTAQSLLPRFSNLGFKTKQLFRRSRHYLFDLPKFVFYTLRQKPDGVLFQGPLKVPMLEGAISVLFRCFGIRTALTIHDVLPHYPRAWSRFEFAWFYQRFDRLIVHSSAAQEAVRDLGVKRPLLVVPHGAYDLFRLSGVSRAQARQNLGAGNIADGDFVALFFGHLEPRKGLMEFIEVAQQMRNAPGMKFVIAGGNDMASHGSEYAKALSEAKALPNVLVRDERIPFEEVENFFAASDVVALPYREGTTSGVLKLAIAFGIPIVASRVGDLPEEVPVGGGVLFDAGEGLANHLHEALLTVREQHPLFVNAMKGAAGNSDWAPIAKAYAEFIFSEEAGYA